jgi:hypothetical protein
MRREKGEARRQRKPLGALHFRFTNAADGPRRRYVENPLVM